MVTRVVTSAFSVLLLAATAAPAAGPDQTSAAPAAGKAGSTAGVPAARSKAKGPAPVPLAIIVAEPEAPPAVPVRAVETAKPQTVAAVTPTPPSFYMTQTVAPPAPPPAAVAAADSSPLLSLDEALAIARKENRGLRTASLEVDRAGDRIGAARARRWPGIRFGFEADYPLVPLELTFQKGDFGTFPATGPIPSKETVLGTQGWLAAVTAGVVQPLAGQWRMGLIVDQLGVAQNIAREDLRAQSQSVTNDVKRGYYVVLQAQSALEAVREAVRSLQELDRVVTEQLAERKALRADSLDVKTRLAQAESDAFTVSNDLATRKEFLNHLLGRDPGMAFRVSPVSEVSLFEANLEAARLQALQQRPEVTRADLQVRAAEFDVRIKKAEYIPDLDLIVRYAHPATAEQLPQHIALAGVSLSWEVFDWGRKRREAAEREKALEQAQAGAAETRSRILLDVNTRFRKLEEAKSRLRVAELGREAARERLQVTTARYGERVVLLADVLQAQAAVASANDQHQSAVLAFWVARADFDRALGEEN